jgi:hypothetical protein
MSEHQQRFSDFLAPDYSLLRVTINSMKAENARLKIHVLFTGQVLNLNLLQKKRIEL